MGVAGVNCQVGGGESRLEADAIWQRDIVQNGYTLGGVGRVGGKHTGLQVIGKRGQLVKTTAHNRHFMSMQAGESWWRHNPCSGLVITEQSQEEAYKHFRFSLVVAGTLLRLLHLLTAQSRK